MVDIGYDSSGVWYWLWVGGFVDRLRVWRSAGELSSRDVELLFELLEGGVHEVEYGDRVGAGRDNRTWFTWNGLYCLVVC